MANPNSNTTMPSSSTTASQQQEQLLLEAAAPPASVDEVVHKLDISNGPASLSLGPLVVHEDGTLSRVQNWDTMTQGERDTTMRVLVARNRRRLDKLRELEREGKLPSQQHQQQQQQQQGTNDNGGHTEL